MLVELLINGGVNGTKLGLAGLGFAIIYYTSKDFHFAYGTLLTTAGYFAYAFISLWSVPAPLGVLLAVGLSILLGVAVRFYLYRPLGSHLAILLMSLGFTIVAENLLAVSFGTSDVILPTSLSSIVVVGPAHLSILNFVIAAVFLGAWGLAWVMLHRSRVGLAVRGVMHDADMAELVGISAQRTVLLAYALGSGLGALSGLFMAADTGIRPSTGFDILLYAFLVTVAGMGSIHRVAVWSMAVGILGGLFSWQLPTQYQTLAIFLLFLIYMVLRSRINPAMGR